MLFNSLTFLVFFVVVFGLHRLIPGWGGKKLLLLAASYVFYAAWNPPYVAILLFSTSLDWWLARLIWKSEDPRRRRLLLTLSLVANLSLLGFFKYGSFLLDNTRLLLGALGVDYQPPALDIVLPIGISFYTFASLSYTIDVYRREVEGDAGFLDYALFVSFFPHLVAGPIVRARQLLPQIKVPRTVSRDQLGWGLTLVVLGLFTKTVLADSVFAPVVDAAYGTPGMGALESWGAVLGFSGQIYCDFAGYSLCAIGLALCFGFEFPDNFRYPYAARGFSDFWRRWHTTLSSWLRDYLYVPLGGNRHGEGRTYLNLMLTMLIGGLWHGASWMFVLWGGLHGAYLAAERALRGAGRDAPLPRGKDWLFTAFTFLMVTLTWIPFRAKDAHTAGTVFAGLWRPDIAPGVDSGSLLICYAAMALLLAWQFQNRDISLEERFADFSTTLQAAVVGACLVAIFLCSGGDERAFIYFQF
ncbi:MAG TPA: MBOAT family O-acyltransferase [Gammaproteobacteria bacterium]